MFDFAPESFKNLIRCLLVEMFFFFGLLRCPRFFSVDIFSLYSGIFCSCLNSFQLNVECNLWFFDCFLILDISCQFENNSTQLVCHNLY